MRMGYEFDLDRTLSIGDSSGNLIPHDRYTFYRDSILALLTDDRKLIVRGIYGPGESMTNGLRRAETVLKDFAPSLEQDRYEIYSKGLGERSDLQAEVWVDNREVDTAQQVKSDVESPSSLEIE